MVTKVGALKKKENLLFKDACEMDQKKKLQINDSLIYSSNVEREHINIKMKQNNMFSIKKQKYEILEKKEEITRTC